MVCVRASGGGASDDFLALDTADHAARCAHFEVDERVLHVGDGTLVFITGELGIQMLGAVDQNGQQGFVGQAVDTVFGNRSLLETQGSGTGAMDDLVNVALLVTGGGAVVGTGKRIDSNTVVGMLNIGIS